MGTRKDYRLDTTKGGPLAAAAGASEPLSYSPKADGATTASRLLGLDATRGIALIGMVAVHALVVSDPFGNPTLTTMVAAGRSAATFAVLAGVGIALTTGRSRVRFDRRGMGSVRAVVIRALAIGAIGLMLGYSNIQYGAVILPYYAMLFLLVIPLLFLSTWAVTAVALIAAGGMPVLSHLVRDELPAPRHVNPSWQHLVDDPVRLLTELLLTGRYPALPWLAYAAFGLAIGRLGLSSIRVAVGLLSGGLALAVAAATTSWYLLHRRGGLQRIDESTVPTDLSPADVREILALGADGSTPTTTWWWLVVNARHSATPVDLLHSAGCAIALLGVMLLLARITLPILRPVLAVVLVPLAGVGALPLTLYTAHIVFMNSELDTFDQTRSFVIQVVTGVVFGLAWRATAGRGPLEAMVSWLARRAWPWPWRPPQACPRDRGTG